MRAALGYGPMEFCDIPRDAVRGEGGLDLPEPLISGSKPSKSKSSSGSDCIVLYCTVAVYFKQLITLSDI
jgi:hypothetical protein